MITTEQHMAAGIAGLLEERGISQAAFCRMVGVSPKHLNQVLLGNAGARSQALDYWAFALGKRFVVTLENIP